MAPRSHNLFACAGRSCRGRGFTFVELMIGMVVTALVMTALAALMGAVAQGWRQNATVAASTNLSAQAHLRLQKCLKGVHLIGAVRTGSLDGTSPTNAAMLLWKADSHYDWR